MASTDEVSSTKPCGIMPSRAPTVDSSADEGTWPANSSEKHHESALSPGVPAASHSSLTLEANNAKPSGIMMMLAKRTIAFSAFMISELTFLTYLASLLILAT